MKKIKELFEFLTDGIWKIKLIDLPKKKQFIYENIRIIVLTCRGFTHDNCVLRASSLTFFTLLSIVPVFAMAFGVAKSFNLQGMLEKQLKSAFEGMQGHEEVLQKILEFSQNQLANTQGGVIAGIGVLFLFWAIVKLLGNIEWAFNEIWGIKENRSLTRKIADYLIIVVVTPIFLVIAGGATAFIGSQPEVLMHKYEFFRLAGPVFILLLKLMPLCILTPLFTFLYIFMPNTKISIKSGLLAGLFAALCFMGIQILYFHLQVVLFSKYSAIYGSFAAMPLFLIWLEVSWMIVLLGAELSFAEQNVKTCEFESDSQNASLNFKRKIAVCITSFVVERFDSEQPPPTTEEIQQELEIPFMLANIILYDLVKVGILIRVIGDNGERENAYLPAIPEKKLSIYCIIERLDLIGSEDLPFTDKDKYKKVDQALQDFRKRCDSSKANVVLSEL